MKLNKYIDHTLLKADCTDKEIKTLCEEAIKYDFYSVCVNSCHVQQCNELLKHSEVKIATVVGFPLGAMSTASKVFEAEDACKNGASEIDMVINIGKLKSGDYTYVENDIHSVCETAKLHGSIVKVIIETCLLTKDEITQVCEIATKAGAHFVKTSTGFSTDGATAENVKLIRASIPKFMQVKASGGIRNYEKAVEMIEAGADRIGTSSGVKIMKESK